MPPQKYCRSGPFFAAAAALNAGTSPFVDWSTVLIVTFGCFLWYSATVCASHAFAPAASCSPHHHIVRFTGPVGNAFVAAPPAGADPRAVAAPSARATTAPATSSAPLVRRRPVIDAPFVCPPTGRPYESQLQPVAGEDLATVRRHQHNLLDAHAFAVLVAPGLERDYHPRLERRLRPRHDSRLLVPVATETVAGMVRIVEPVPRERVEVAGDHTRSHRVEHPRQRVGRTAMVCDRLRRRHSEREGRARVAPVPRAPRHEIAEDELAFGHRATLGCAAGRGSARAGDEVGEDRRPGSRCGLDRASHACPELELRQS